MFFFQYILAPHCLYRDLRTLIHGTIILTVRIIVPCIAEEILNGKLHFFAQWW